MIPNAPQHLLANTKVTVPDTGVQCNVLVSSTRESTKMRPTASASARIHLGKHACPYEVAIHISAEQKQIERICMYIMLFVLSENQHSLFAPGGGNPKFYQMFVKIS